MRTEDIGLDGRDQTFKILDNVIEDNPSVAQQYTEEGSASEEFRNAAMQKNPEDISVFRSRQEIEADIGRADEAVANLKIFWSKLST